MAAPILHHKSLPLRCFGGSPAPNYFNFFSAKDICTINFTFFTFIYIWNHVRSVSFSDGGSRDRDIIFRDRRYLVFCFLGCVVKFQAREAYITAGGEARARILAIEFVCFFSFFLFFSIFFLPTFSIFSRSNAHRHSHNQRRCRETWKGRKETLESSALHSICGLQINVWLGVII